LSSSDSAPDLHQDQIEEETDDNWAEEDLQIQAQMQLLDERLSRHDEWWAGEVAKAGERAAVAAEEHLSQGPIESAGEGDSSSISTVSSSRYEGLEEEWWKEDSEVAAVRSQEQIGNSEALAVRSRGKRVRWE
jgi:hypothetical protein